MKKKPDLKKYFVATYLQNKTHKPRKREKVENNWMHDITPDGFAANLTQIL